MISILREFTKSWAFKGLMVVLMIGFLVFGVNKFGNDGPSTQNVVSAGDRSVTTAKFRSVYDNVRQNYEQQRGQAFTAEEFVAGNQHTILINQLADQSSLLSWLDRLGVKGSSRLVAAKIAEVPAFINSVTGRFDPDAYKQLLSSRGIRVEDFENEQRDSIAQQQYADAVMAALEAPRVYATTYAAFTLQTRDASLFTISPQNVPQPPAPTEAQIAAFYKDNLETLKQPETRQASVVLFAPEVFMKDIQIDDAELHTMFDARRNSLATPETRSFVQITAKDMASANKIAAALNAGQSPEAVAKSNKGEIITYTAKPKTAVADPKVADAAFALATGQVSAPIQGNLGIAVVKMRDIRIGSTPSFESVRETLANDLRKDKAADKLNKVSNAFSDAINKGEDFDATARRLGLTVAPLLPMTSDGHAKDPQTGRPIDYSTYGPVVKAVFALQQPGSASDVEALTEGQYFAVRLDAMTPAGAPPLAAVHAEMAYYWQAKQVEDAVTAKAKEARARLEKGESVAAVAASYGARVVPLKDTSRETAEKQRIPGPLAERIFTGKVGQVFDAQLSQVAVVVGRIDAVHEAAAADANARSIMVANQMSQSVESDIVALTTRDARKLVGTKTSTEAALRALNIDPPAKDGKKDGKKDDKKAGKDSNKLS